MRCAQQPFLCYNAYKSKANAFKRLDNSFMVIIHKKEQWLSQYHKYKIHKCSILDFFQVFLNYSWSYLSCKSLKKLKFLEYWCIFLMIYQCFIPFSSRSKSNWREKSKFSNLGNNWCPGKVCPFQEKIGYLGNGWIWESGNQWFSYLSAYHEPFSNSNP